MNNSPVCNHCIHNHATIPEDSPKNSDETESESCCQRPPLGGPSWLRPPLIPGQKWPFWGPKMSKSRLQHGNLGVLLGQQSPYPQLMSLESLV